MCRIKKILISGLAIVVCISYYFLLVHFHIGIPCLFRRLTGLLCPGCGISRMMIDIIHFNFHSAYYHNQAIFLLSPFILYFVAKTYISWLFDKKMKINLIENIILYIIIAILIIFGIWRNIW